MSASVCGWTDLRVHLSENGNQMLVYAPQNKQIKPIEGPAPKMDAAVPKQNIVNKKNLLFL